MSGAAADDALVADLARAVVEQTAPEELPLFRATSEAYFDDPDVAERSGCGDEMLGFGVDAALVLVTPVALSVARDVVELPRRRSCAQRAEHRKARARSTALARPRCSGATTSRTRPAARGRGLPS